MKGKKICGPVGPAMNPMWAGGVGLLLVSLCVGLLWSDATYAILVECCCDTWRYSSTHFRRRTTLFSMSTRTSAATVSGCCQARKGGGPLNRCTTFRNFDDYWFLFLGGQSPAPSYTMSLSEEKRIALRDHIRLTLPIASDGSIHLIARAWAARGVRKN